MKRSSDRQSVAPALPPRLIGLVRQLMQQREESRRLPDEQTIRRQSPHGRDGGSLRLGWPNDRARREPAVQKNGGLRHDQVRLQVLADGGDAQVRKRKPI